MLSLVLLSEDPSLFDFEVLRLLRNPVIPGFGSGQRLSP